MLRGGQQQAADVSLHPYGGEVQQVASPPTSSCHRRRFQQWSSSALLQRNHLGVANDQCHCSDESGDDGSVSHFHPWWRCCSGDKHPVTISLAHRMSDGFSHFTFTNQQGSTCNKSNTRSDHDLNCSCSFCTEERVYWPASGRNSCSRHSCTHRAPGSVPSTTAWYKLVCDTPKTSILEQPYNITGDADGTSETIVKPTPSSWTGLFAQGRSVKNTAETPTVSTPAAAAATETTTTTTTTNEGKTTTNKCNNESNDLLHRQLDALLRRVDAVEGWCRSESKRSGDMETTRPTPPTSALEIKAATRPPRLSSSSSSSSSSLRAGVERRAEVKKKKTGLDPVFTPALPSQTAESSAGITLERLMHAVRNARRRAMDPQQNPASH